ASNPLDQFFDSSGLSIQFHREKLTKTKTQKIIISQEGYNYLKALERIEDKKNKNTMDLDKYLSQNKNNAVLDTKLAI
ncbi:44791_t:CDS:2, partial [Gigaspora margarita]